MAVADPSNKKVAKIKVSFSFDETSRYFVVSAREFSAVGIGKTVDEALESFSVKVDALLQRFIPSDEKPKYELLIDEDSMDIAEAREAVLDANENGWYTHKEVFS